MAGCGPFGFLVSYCLVVGARCLGVLFVISCILQPLSCLPSHLLIFFSAKYIFGFTRVSLRTSLPKNSRNLQWPRWAFSGSGFVEQGLLDHFPTT